MPKKFLWDIPKMRPNSLINVQCPFVKAGMALAKCFSCQGKPKIFCACMRIETQVHTHTFVHTSSHCVTKSEMKWISIIGEIKSRFLLLLFTWVIWFLVEWDLNYYDLFSNGAHGCIFCILISGLEKPFGGRKKKSHLYDCFMKYSSLENWLHTHTHTHC